MAALCVQISPELIRDNSARIAESGILPKTHPGGKIRAGKTEKIRRFVKGVLFLAVSVSALANRAVVGII